MNIHSIALNLKKTAEELPRLTTRHVFIARRFGLSLLLGSAEACRVESRAATEAHEFFDPADLPWHPAPGHGSGVWERIVSGGQDEGVTTRFLRFDPGSGRDEVVTHDFWERDLYRLGDLRVRRGGVQGRLRSSAPVRLPFN